jgi:hypothetical protein
METAQIIEILLKILPFVVTFVIGTIGGWEILKSKITKMKMFFEIVEKALYDNAVSEEEFVAIWEAGKDIFKK